MAMLGMQTDMQCGYLPACYSSWDLNINASCSTWPLNNVNKIFKNGHNHNCGLTPPSPDQHFAYKELLKQKMLQHEAIFRDQIHELHRLYNRQRELMDEVKRSGLYRHHPWLENLQSNPVLSQNSFEYSQKTSQVSTLPWLNPACSQSTISGVEYNVLHLSYDEGKVAQAGRVCALTECYIKESELLESKCKKVGKKILDLELPADEYIDVEEEESLAGDKIPQVPEKPSYPLKIISEDMPRSDVEPTIGISDLNLVFQEDNMAAHVLSRKTKELADLNEPIRLEEEIDTNSNDFPGPISHNREIPSQDLSGKTNSDLQVQPKEIVQNIQIKGDPEACTNTLHLDKNESQQQWLSENDEAGQKSSDLNSFPEGVCAETLSMSSEDAEIEQAREISTSHLLDQTSRNLPSKRETFGRQSFDSTINSYPGQVADACEHTSNQLVPLADNESSSVSSWRKHTRDFIRAPIAVQALPCFNNYVQLSKSFKNRSLGIAGVKSPHGKNHKYNPNFHGASVHSSFCNSDDEFASEDNGPKGSGDVKSTRDIDLNSISPSCFSDVADQSVWISDGEKKLEDSMRGSPWFRAKPVHVAKPNKGYTRSTTQVKSISLQANAYILDVKSKKAEASDRQGIERLLGIPTYNKPCKSIDPCSSHAFPLTIENSSEDDTDNSERDCVLDINLDCNSVRDSGEQLTANELAIENRRDKKFSCCGFPVDLNPCINEDESSLAPSLSNDLDLEAPESSQNKESSPPRGESYENQLEKSFQPSGMENGDPLEELTVIAAEALVSISSSQVQACTESTMFKPSKASRIDCLYWFARIVSSVVDDPESEFGVVLSCEDTNPHNKHLSDGIDYFEAMTLQLKETTMQEYCCKTYFQKEEAACPVSFPCQPRKGRTRRVRQQRKDFQSEILPSLASLSRYEVTQDLQAIGGLIEASHTHWSTGSRQAGRNGSTRRKRPFVSISNVESAMCAQLKQQTRHSQLCIKERSLIDWGKITRRPRGQRCPASNTRLILAQLQVQ